MGNFNSESLKNSKTQKSGKRKSPRSSGQSLSIQNAQAQSTIGRSAANQRGVARGSSSATTAQASQNVSATQATSQASQNVSATQATSQASQNVSATQAAELQNHQQILDSVTQSASTEQVQNAQQQEQSTWQKIKGWFKDSFGSVGSVWDRIYNIGSALGLESGLDIIENIRNLYKGGVPDWGVFFGTIKNGLKEGVSNFFENIVANVLKIGANLLNFILPDDCQLESLNLSSIIKFVIQFLGLEKVAASVYAIISKKPQGVKEVFVTILQSISEKVVKNFQISSLLKGIAGGFFSLIKANPIVGMVTKYLGKAASFIGGVEKCIAAACDGSVDFIANALENALCEIPSLLCEIAVDCLAPAFLDTVKSAVSEARSFASIGGILEKLGLTEKYESLKEKTNDALGNKLGLGSLAQKLGAENDDEAMSAGDAFETISSGLIDNVTDLQLETEPEEQATASASQATGSAQTTAQPKSKRRWLKEKALSVFKKSKEQYFDDDLVKAAKGTDLKAEKGKNKAKELSKDGYTVAYVKPGGELPAIDNAKIPAAMKKDPNLKFNQGYAHIETYVVSQDATGDAIYRSPLPEQAEKAIKAAKGELSAGSFKTRALAQFLGVDEEDMKGFKGTSKAILKNAVNFS